MARVTPNAVSKTMIAPSRLQITGLSELWELAQLLYKGGAASMPNVDRPEKVFTIILHGLEVGLAPTQALANIMMQPNGRCSIGGDGALALVRASGLLAKHVPETTAGEGDDETGVCVIQRVNEPEARFTFSMAEAKKAGLIERAKGKEGKGTGPWISYPTRMLKMRARGFALRDIFPDVLKGLITTEEAQDQLAVEMGEPRVVQVQATVDAPKAITSGGADPTPVTITQADLSMSADQLQRVAWIKRQLGVSKSLTEKADIDKAWKALLGEYGVESAKDFTFEKCAAFLAAEEPKHDPFIHPPASPTT